MVIERTDKEVIIRIPSSVNIDNLQKIIDYLTYKEATANSEAAQEDVDLLATEAKKGWWSKNKSKLLK